MHQTHSRLQKIYTFYSPFYDLVFNKVMEEGRKVSVELLNPKAGERVLDVGVGTGLNLSLLPRNVQVEGIDICGEMLEKARKRAGRLGFQGAQFHQMDACAMDFQDGTFDSAMVLYTLSTVPHPLQMLREIRRVCKPGARIVITNHFRSHNAIVRGIERRVHGVCKNLGFETTTPLEVIEEAELTALNSCSVNFLPLWRAVLCVNKDSTGTLARVVPLSRKGLREA